MMLLGRRRNKFYPMDTPNIALYRLVNHVSPEQESMKPWSPLLNLVVPARGKITRSVMFLVSKTRAKLFALRQP